MKMFLKNVILFSVLLVGLSGNAAPKPDIKLPLPGQTLANVKLQSDTLIPVYVSASRFAMKSCDAMSITDTKVTKKPHNLKSQNGTYIAGEWEERWTVFACGSKIYVPVKFILDSTGATYVIHPDKISVTHPMN